MPQFDISTTSERNIGKKKRITTSLRERERERARAIRIEREGKYLKFDFKKILLSSLFSSKYKTIKKYFPYPKKGMRSVYIYLLFESNFFFMMKYY